jgi:BASS family bile acid:Na+ symporter
MLTDLLNKVATTALLGFVVSSMMAMGVGFTVGQIIDALRDVRLVLLALLANFVVMPLGALALDKMLSLDEPLGVGLLLLGASAGAPFLPKLTELAKGNLPFAVGIMMLLAIGTVGYLPLVLPLLLPGVEVNSAKIGGWLFLLTLLPLAAGLALRARYAGLAARVKPVLDWVSNVILVPMVLLLAVANIDKILHVFGTRGILAGLLLIALGFGIGWMLGGPGVDIATGVGSRYRATQHRRRARGCERRLQRSKRGNHGDSCYDSRIADADATMPRAGHLWRQAIHEVAVMAGSDPCASAA